MASIIQGGFVQNIALGADGSETKTVDPWTEQLWDIHRRIRDYYRKLLFSKPQGLRRLSEYDLQLYISKQVVEFAFQYGDLFDPTGSKKHSSYLTEDNTDFIQEWKQIAEAVDCLDAGDVELLINPRLNPSQDQEDDVKSVISTKLQKFTIPVPLLPDSSVKQAGSQTIELFLQPTSLAGWIWLLIARDITSSVTYSPCTGNRVFPGGEQERLSKRLAASCGREVPNISPLGRKMIHCSRNCAQRYYRKNQTYKRNATSRAVFSSDTEAINASNFKYGTPAGEAEFLNEDLPNTRAASKTFPPLPHWVRG